MSRLLPPLHLLRALVATARHGTVVRAAEELHLTAGAVSRQLSELENLLGRSPFVKVRNRLQLTEPGQKYVESVIPLLEEIEQVTLDLLAASGGEATQKQILGLSMLPTFGARWLIPRLSDFYARHPGIDIAFVPFAQGYDFSDPKLDCAIRYGSGVWPGARAHYLAGRELVVIAPTSARASLGRPADALAFTLLHHVTEPEGWARWCAHHGLSTERALVGPRLDQVSTQVQAVVAGMGVALVPRVLVADDIAAGNVFEARFLPYAVAAGYYFCYPESKAQLPALEAFREWLIGQAGVSRPSPNATPVS